MGLTKIVAKRILLFVTPILVFLSIAVLVSADGFSLSNSVSNSGSGCERPH